MKFTVEYFSKKKLLFKSFHRVELSRLKTRKKLKVFSATDIKGNYHSILHVESKSRFLLKNAQELVVIEDRLIELENHNFKFKHLFLKSPICSKAEKYLKEIGWQLHYDFV